MALPWPPLNVDDNMKGQNMEYAIMGSGAIGSALARRFVAGKIEVAVANSKGPESLATLVHELGPLVKPVTTAEALRAEVVILAIPFDAVPDAVHCGRCRPWGWCRQGVQYTSGGQPRGRPFGTWRPSCPLRLG